MDAPTSFGLDYMAGSHAYFFLARFTRAQWMWGVLTWHLIGFMALQELLYVGQLDLSDLDPT